MVLQRINSKRMCIVTKEFMEMTSLHGYKYVVERRSTCQMFLWLLICICGLAVAVFLVSIQWIRFQSSPTTMGIETLSYPTSSVPFPAITICTNSIYDESTQLLRKQLEKNGIKTSIIDSFFMSLPSLVTNEPFNEILNPDYLRIMNILQRDSKFTIETLMKYVMEPCDKLIIKCRWLNNAINCSEIIQVVRSFNGYCCSFNYFENNGSNVKTIKKLVKYVSGAGEYISLKLTLNLSNLLYVTERNGAKVLIHEWYTFPSQTFQEAVISPGQHVTFQVEPEVVESSSDVRTFKKSQRMCVFTDEINLNISYEYSYKSCLTECRIREINRLCQCNPYFYPKLNKIRTCTWFDIECLNENRKIYYSLQPNAYSKRNIEEPNGLGCDCVARCNQFLYKVRCIVTEKSEYRNMTLIPHLIPMNISTLEIYFKDFTCVKYLRNVFMTWDGLLASFGGIFGLCMGASLISVTEILFYFCVKYNLYNMFYKNSEKSASAKARVIQVSENVIRPGELTFKRRIALPQQLFEK